MADSLDVSLQDGSHIHSVRRNARKVIEHSLSLLLQKSLPIKFLHFWEQEEVAGRKSWRIRRVWQQLRLSLIEKVNRCCCCVRSTTIPFHARVASLHCAVSFYTRQQPIYIVQYLFTHDSSQSTLVSFYTRQQPSHIVQYPLTHESSQATLFSILLYTRKAKPRCAKSHATCECSQAT